MKRSKYSGKRKIDINQKSFAFTHRYDQTKFNSDKLDNIKNIFQTKIHNRLILSSIIFCALFFSIAIQTLKINFIYNPKSSFYSKQEQIIRPNILDRNKISLTANLKMSNIGIRPSNIHNKKKFIKKINSIENLSLPLSKIDKAFEKNFFYLKRNASNQDLQIVLNTGETGIEIEESYKRKYLHKSLFSHVLGEVDIDNNGISGMEKSVNKIIDNGDYDPIITSLDLRVQNIVRDEILEGMNIYNAKGGAGIILNINNGEIIAMVSLPDFDPNDSSGEKFNRNTLGLYEFGSVMKSFTTAIGLEENKFTLGTKYKIEKQIKVGKDLVSDVHSACDSESCSVEDIFVHSSNIGTVKMVRDIGVNLQQNYLNELGLFNKIDIDIPEIARPIRPDPWRSVSTDTISYGYGLSISPLHLALATGTILNGGYLIKPTLIKNSEEKILYGQIFSESTSEMMRYLFSKVVTKGTARTAFGYNERLTYNQYYNYNTEFGYLVGGKTGTAKKSSSAYKDGRITTFISAFPINKPKYLVLISLDEPQGIDDRGGKYDTFNNKTAGWNATRVNKNIIDRIGPILDIKTKYKLDDTDLIINTLFN